MGKEHSYGVTDNLYKNRKYPRAEWHDYNYGLYFVTVVTKYRRNHFGKIDNGYMQHSELGGFLSRAIEQCGLHYEGISVDCHIVMPNHFHAIINVGSRHAAAGNNNAAAGNEINIGCLLPPMHPDENDNFNERNHHNARLSAVIGGIKSATTRYANQKGFDFGWQANFHDHIIRNQREYDYISEYIKTNPLRWGNDKFYN